MQKFVLACTILAGITTAASADEQGIASYYHHPRYGGLIAAHRTLPFGTQVKVINLDNGRSAVLNIVDRGPFIRGRIIDVSVAAANVLGFRNAGICHVRIEKL
jgi:rare lipoprotein A